MASSYEKTKTEQSVLFSPIGSFLSQSQSQTGFPYLNKRPNQIARTNSAKQSFKLKLKERLIDEQNIRLITKIIQINNRKLLSNKKDIPICAKKRINPQKQRGISLENKRLGKSLVMIKTGKSIERIKTEIAQSSIIMKRSSKNSNFGLNLFQELSTTQRQKGIQSGIFAQGKNIKNINIDSLIQSKCK